MRLARGFPGKVVLGTPGNCEGGPRIYHRFPCSQLGFPRVSCCFYWDFLGSPRISIRILPGFRLDFDSDSILIRFWLDLAWIWLGFDAIWLDSSS